MLEVSAAESNAKLSSPLDVVEAGQSVVITHLGKAIAELVPRCAVRDLLPQLQALRDSLPEQTSSAVDTFQSMRLYRCKAQRGSGDVPGIDQLQANVGREERSGRSSSTPPSWAKCSWMRLPRAVCIDRVFLCVLAAHVQLQSLVEGRSRHEGFPCCNRRRCNVFGMGR